MIFGGGFVGGNVAHAALASGWHATIADCVQRPGVEGADWRSVDVTDESAVSALVEEARPDAVVNTAAIASIDRAQQEQELARRVNVDGARHVAKSCAAHAVRHVFFSSGAVFDGAAGPYTETNAPAPVNFYGATKAEAEREVLDVHPDAAVVRISLVLGFPVTGGNSFLARLETRLQAGETVPCPTDEIRTPVDVATLCDCVLELAGNDYRGVIHLGCTQAISRYELTSRIAARMGFDEHLVVPTGGEEHEPGRAPRHKRGIISVARAQEILTTRLPDVEETIERALGHRPCARGETIQ
jgi:dTDP-4-dehydrorhamnose reductase